MVNIHCPKCDQRIANPLRLMHQVIRCTRCGAALTVKAVEWRPGEAKNGEKR